MAGSRKTETTGSTGGSRGLKEKTNAEEAQKKADRTSGDYRRMLGELLTVTSQEGHELQLLRQLLVKMVVDMSEDIVASQPDDIGVIESYARSLAARGTITGQFGSVDKAVKDLEKAIQIQQQLAAKDPNHPNASEHKFRAASRV